MASKNTFLLGLGNQKCGTTWLHRYLSRQASFDGGFAKEYHIWDALDVPLKKSAMVGRHQRLLCGKKGQERYKMQQHTAYYFDYFLSLYTNGATLSADITPSYSGLGIPRLRYIREQFCQRGISTKAIVLIRDPVTRIKSAVRSNLDKLNYFEGIRFGETDFLVALDQYYRSEHCHLRTFYPKIITNAFEAFGEHNIYVGIYEEMFTRRGIEKLSDFCGFSADSEYMSVHVNRTKNPVEQSDFLEADIRREYKEVYDYCHKNFSRTRYLWN